MATKTIINSSTVKSLSTKNYYSWINEGKGSTAYVISDSLSSLLFDVGTSSAGTEAPALISLEHGTQNASVRTIASGFAYAGQDSVDFYAPKAVAINSVKATSIYGGAVVTTKSTYKSGWYYSNSINSKKTETDATVKGDVNLLLASVKATSVYGGGAGYGSSVEGDVSITVAGTSTISNLFGGGQKGASVGGDVNITIDRTGNNGGRISSVYGGGENADVFGNVNITVRGTNAVGINTISGEGKGTTGMVHGSKTLDIADYSGQFTATIKAFDLIRFTGDTAVTLTKSQDKTVKSATYEFLIDGSAFGQSSEAMLVWNQKVDTGHFVVTIDTDDDFVANGFEGKKIYYSKYLTEKAAANISVQTLAGEDIDDSMYTLEFVADTDNKGDAKKQGGYVVLNYAGSNYSVTADTLEDVLLTSASDRVNIKGDVVDVFVDTGSGNDRVAVQSGTEMRGDIYLGKGTNVLNVQQNALVTGSVVVSADSKNTINLNGAINQIEGGDATTQNIVNINNANALGGYDLTFENDTADTVVVSTASNYSGNINFGKGKDTLVLNTNFTAGSTITSDDGNDIIVANKSGVTIDATNFRLTGTDNALVIANGVVADVDGFAFGDFANLKSDTFSKGLYLGQNAILGNGDAGNDIAVSSFNGDFHLKGDMTILAKDQLDATADAELIARIGDYYTAGTGVNGDIYAAGRTVKVLAGAEINGTIAGDVKSNADANVLFLGTSGGDITFDTAKITVGEDAVATVSSIKGLDTRWDDTLGTKNYLEADLAKITLKNDAKVVATADDVTVVGPITRDTAFDTKTVAFKGTVKDTAKVALADQQAIFAQGSDVEGAEFAFAGENELLIKSNITFDNKKLTLAENAKVSATVYEEGVLAVDGIVNGERSKIAPTDVTLENNAVFSIGNTSVTGDWTRTFDGMDLGKTKKAITKGNVIVRADSQLVKGIDLSANTTITDLTIRDGVLVKNDKAEAAIKLGAAVENLTIGAAEVYGEINAKNGTEQAVVLNGTTVKGVDGNNAITLGKGDTLVADNATITGNFVGGKNVGLTNNTVLTGNLEAATAGLNGALVENSDVLGAATGNVWVKGESVITTVGAEDKAAVVLVDGANVGIDNFVGPNVMLGIINGATVNGATKNLAGVELTSDNSTVYVVDSTVAAITQVGQDSAKGALDSAVEVNTYWDKGGNEFNAETAKIGNIVQKAAEDTTLGNANVVVGRWIEQKYDGTEAYPEAKDPITGNLDFETGDVTQAAADNRVRGGVVVDADGKYREVEATWNNSLHKEAVVELDAVKVAYGDVAQTGDSNVVGVGIVYAADGESDVTVKGASTLTLGNVVQWSENAAAFGDPTETVNAVNVSLAAVAGASDAKVVSTTEGAQSKLTLGGDITANVGSIMQVAYNNDNFVSLNTRLYSEKASAAAELVAGNITADDMAGKAYGEIVGDAKVELTVSGEKNEDGTYGDAITMLAVGGVNALDLNVRTVNGALPAADDAFFGKITVNGDINVGGVISVDEAKAMTGTEYASWGDRVARQNNVNADAGTVTINGNLSMIALHNTLVINNSTGEEASLAKEIYVAGNDNDLTIGTGVTTDNIHFYALKDYDKFGQEEYELGLPTYTNTLTVKGVVKEVVIDALTSEDNIYVYGGTVKGDVITRNGEDTVVLGTDGATEVLGDSTVGGNVVMGVKDAAEGDNTLELHTFTVGTDEDAKDYSAKIGGNVEQYADSDSDNWVKLYNDTTSAEDETTASISTGNITQVGGYNDIDNWSDSYKAVKVQLGDISQTSDQVSKTYEDGDDYGSVSNYIDLSGAAGIVGAVTQKVEVADELGDDGKIIVKAGDNYAEFGGAEFGGIAMKGILQEADGTNELDLDGEVHQIGDGSKEDPYQDVLSVNHSTVTGDIIQKSTYALDKEALADAAVTKFSDLVTDNDMSIQETNVTGNITQTGNNRNVMEISGYGAYNTLFKDGNGDEQTYTQAVPLTIDGSVTQQGALNNKLDVDDATITGTVTQTGTVRNKATFTSGTGDVATNMGDITDHSEYGDCAYEGGDGHNDGIEYAHVSETIKVNGYFNTQSVGDVNQTISLPDEEVLKAVADKGLKAYNLIDADNTNVGNVTQVNPYGWYDESISALISNRIEVDGASIEYGVEYVAEIDEGAAHADVKKVHKFTATNSVTVGNIDQDGINNDVILNDVSKVGTVKQTAASGKDAAGDDYLANNMALIAAADDHTQYIVNVAKWEGDKEVFTPTVLAGTENVRTAAKVGAIEQLNAATGNYSEQTKNTVELTTADVTGDVVQTATGKDANVLNSFTATTTKQEFTDVYVADAVKGEIKAIDGGYERATLNKIDGKITQSGFKNEVTLTGTGVTGAVEQTAGVISDYDGHTVVSAQKFGSNEFKAYGLEKDKEVLVKDPDKMENIKLEAKDNIVEIASITQTHDAKMDDKFMTVNEKDGSDYANYVVLNLAKTASITQNATGNGNNWVTLENSSDVTSISQTNTQFTWKDGNDVEQTTTGSSGVKLVNSTVGTITQSSGNDTITLNGDSVLGSASLGDGDDNILVTGNAKVTGTLDFGAQSPAGDKDDILTITSKTADLSEATVKNVERIVLNNFMGGDAGNVIKVKEIDTGDLDIVKKGSSTKVASLDVDKLTVGKFAYESGLKIGDVDGTAESAVNLTFNEGLGEKATLVGTKLTDADDAVTFNKSITAAVEIKDFESVTFAKGAQATNDTTWTGTGTIEFDLSSIEGFKDTAEKGTASFTLGDITDYYDGSFPTGDYDRVEFLAADKNGTGDNRFTYQGYDLGTSSHVWTSEDTSDKITKTSTSMAVTYVNV